VESATPAAIETVYHGQRLLELYVLFRWR